METGRLAATKDHQRSGSHRQVGRCPGEVGLLLRPFGRIVNDREDLIQR